MKPRFTILFVVLLLLFCAAPVLAQSETPPEAIPPSLQLDLEALFQAVIKVGLSVLSTLAMYAGLKVVALLRTHLSASQQRFVKSIITEVVLATEQLAKAGKIAETAAAKRLYAENEIKKRLTELGYLTLAANTNRISSGIEASVMEEFNRMTGGLLASWEELGAQDE